MPATLYGGQTHAYDPDIREWATLRHVESNACPIPPAGQGPNWLSGAGSTAVALDPDDIVSVPPCPELHPADTLGPDITVWTDDALFIWGAGFKRDVTTGLLWTPAAPR